MRPGFGVVLLAGSLMPTTLHADATVTVIRGAVLVSKGKGFERTTAATDLRPGDRLLVTEGNAATVVYPDGCAVDIRPGAAHIVGTLSPCVTSQTAAARPACEGVRDGRPADAGDCAGAVPPSLSPGLRGAARVVGVVGTVTIAPLPEGAENMSAPPQP